MKKIVPLFIILFIFFSCIQVAMAQVTGVPGNITGTKTECDNGRDDDGDGLVDYNGAIIKGKKVDKDPQCTSKFLPCENGSTTCSPQTTPTSSAGDDALNIHINNPLSVSTIQDAIKKVMDVVLMLAIPVIIVLYIWAGFTYIMAQGNGEAIKKAHNRLLFTTLGAVIILGAWTIATAVVGTVNMITQ